MCGSRTVTTALEREAERARGRGREREGQGWRRRWEMRVEERGMWEDVVCVCVCVCVFVCIHMATRATRITTEGCSQLPRIPQRLASSILKPRGVFPESGNRLKRMREMKWQGHTHTLTHVRAHKLHDVLIMWVQQRSSCGDRRTWCVPSPAESLPHSCTLGCPYCTPHLFWPFQTVQLWNACSQWGRSFVRGPSEHFSNQPGTNKRTRSRCEKIRIAELHCGEQEAGLCDKSVPKRKRRWRLLWFTALHVNKCFKHLVFFLIFL